MAGDLFIVSRFDVAEVDPAELGSVRADLLDALDDAPGFLGSSAWQSDRSVERFALVSHFSDEDSSRSAYQALVESEVFVEASMESATPPDVVRVRALRLAGRKLESLAGGEFLAYQSAVGAPGSGEQAAQDAILAAQSVELVRGFLGSVVGANADLAEEVVTLTLWADRESAREGVPGAVLYQKID